jgi:hypothetical protein
VFNSPDHQLLTLENAMFRLALSALVAVSFAGSPVLAAAAPTNGESTSFVTELGGGKKKGHKKGHKKHKHKKGHVKKKQVG